MREKLDPNIIRQGDCLLVRTGESGMVAPTDRPLVLKEGEATGHKHAFMAESRVSFRGNGKLAVGATAVLRHEEHDAPTVPAGLYDLPVQVEHCDDDEPRVVAD